MTDLCWQCQRNNTLIMRSANTPDASKDERIINQKNHLQRVNEEREMYREMVKVSKETIGDEELRPHAPCSTDVKAHYSFDYAQQVHFPSNPLQPGPMYFLTPRKCGIFGICSEGQPQQINYLIDEGMCINKGSNAVISYLDHFFTHYGMGEKEVFLHCDNCSGQNKNRFVMQYYAWRVITGQHQDVSLNFMISGHTKFAPDWCFGLCKQSFRRTHVSCLDDISKAFINSTPETGTNQVQLVGTEDGQVFVEQRNWQVFLSDFFRANAMEGMKQWHHFRFTSSEPGVVYVKRLLSDPEIRISMLKKGVSVTDVRIERPVPIRPPGLPLVRQQYLHSSIREFCKEGTEDTVCPQP